MRWLKSARLLGSIALPIMLAPAIISCSSKPVSSSLSGVVSDTSGPLEGVLVQAVDGAARRSIGVFSDASGRYMFPAGLLPAGEYDITVRATGYDLSAAPHVEISGKDADVSLALVPARDPSSQWNNAEWLNAAPVSTAAVDQRFSLNMCTHCHTLGRVFKSTLNADDAEKTIVRMAGYAVGSTPERPQMTPSTFSGGSELALDGRKNPQNRAMAEYIAQNNLSNGRTTWPFTVKPLPRPTGEATKAIIRTWALPRKEALPHDVIVDKDGMAWYTDFGSQMLGRLNPQTGEIKEFVVPTLHEDRPEGMLDIDIAADGSIWLGNLYQGAVQRFDPRTETFKTYPIPAAHKSGAIQIATVAAESAQVDGKVWMADAAITGVRRLDIKTGKVETFLPFDGAPMPAKTGFANLVYGLATDKDNNLYFSNWGGSGLGKIDAKTGAIIHYPTPQVPSRPRRVSLDGQGRLWYAGWQSNTVGYMDIKTGKVRDWPLPTPNSAPYHAMADAAGDVWSAGMATDRVQRLSPQTGKVVEYMLPEQVNARRVFVQNSKNGPIFWVGNNLGASIISVQPIK